MASANGNWSKGKFYSAKMQARLSTIETSYDSTRAKIAPGAPNIKSRLALVDALVA